MRRLLLFSAAAAIALGASSCGGGGDGPSSLPTLSVVTVNIANATDVSGVGWRTRIDRLSAAIARAELVPDIISMTESAGLWNCSSVPFRKAGDYDMADRLIHDLRQRLDARYRIAYMVGASGTVKNFAGTPLCWYYTGDTLLYNPDRLKNLTPDDVAGKAQESHDGPLVGFQVRRSLPLCSRDTNLEPLDQLIDGPPQTERCNQPTPSGPAWAQVDKTRSGDYALVASLARFSLNAASGSSFDVVTTHPMANEEEDHAGPIDDFIAALTGPSYRSSAPYYPLIVLGDFNILTDETRGWPAKTRHVFNPTDVMVVALGEGLGLEPLHKLNVAFASTLPLQEPCRLPEGETNGAFSDHCGLVVRFSGG